MVRSAIFLLLLGASSPAADLQALYDQHRLFDLRDAIATQPSPPFFRAVVACSFNDQHACLKESQAALAANPAADIAAKIHDLLFDLHFSYGRWSEALAALEAEVAIQGESGDPGQTRSLCRAFLRHPPITVELRAPSRIRVLHKNAHVPITANGRPYHAYIDTGANISVIAESAARQLGLAVESADFHFGDASGKGLEPKQVAVADRLVAGNLELRNVPFVVVSDRQQPFAGWGAGKRCILGLQVLLAAQSMTWTSAFPGATLELSRPAAVRDPAHADLCLDGMMPLIAAEYRGRRVTMLLDTGAGKSVLHAAFASALPDLLNLPRKVIHFEGIGGGTKVEATFLPTVSLGTGGRDIAFPRIAVYLKGHGADRYDGMFGNDLTGKASEFTLDFEAMRLFLR